MSKAHPDYEMKRKGSILQKVYECCHPSVRI